MARSVEIVWDVQEGARNVLKYVSTADDDIAHEINRDGHRLGGVTMPR